MTQRDLLLPIAATERIVVLDVLRGVALLGILLMNIEAFAGPLDLALSGVEPHWQGADRVADALVYIFVQGKFYTLFSMLFGMGFAVMAQRAERAGRGFFGMYLRRTAGLLVIGLAHALLLWSGDILVTYALLALLLLGARNAPTVTLPWLAALVYLCAPALVLLYGVAGALMQADQASAVEWKTAMADVAQQAVANVQAQRVALGHGTYLQATVQRWHDLREAMSGLSINGPAMLGMFLLGELVRAQWRDCRAKALPAVVPNVALRRLAAWVGRDVAELCNGTVDGPGAVEPAPVRRIRDGVDRRPADEPGLRRVGGALRAASCLACAGWTHGVEQLPAAVTAVYLDFLWIRAGIFRATAAGVATAVRGRAVRLAGGAEPAMAALVPFRAD